MGYLINSVMVRPQTQSGNISRLARTECYLTIQVLFPETVSKAQDARERIRYLTGISEIDQLSAPMSPGSHGITGIYTSLKQRHRASNGENTRAV